MFPSLVLAAIGVRTMLSIVLVLFNVHVKSALVLTSLALPSTTHVALPPTTPSSSRCARAARTSVCGAASVSLERCSYGTTLGKRLRRVTAR